MPVAPQREVEVFRVHPATLWVTILLALLLQTFLPLKIPLAGLMDFPLLVTVYFTLVRQNKIFGIALGTGLGLMQDALSHGYVGMFGMAKALVGYLAASAAIRFNVESLLARSVVTASLVLLHNLCMAGLQHALLDSPPAFMALDLASAVLVNVALSLIVFPVLDRFR
ncbi:MAG: rod shape-determining protein MreD [Terriglobia bacterium]|jgi:rod shape-determining protein MreD